MAHGNDPAPEACGKPTTTDQANTAQGSTQDSAQLELRKIMQGMDQDPTGMGVTSLARDGVLRAWTADREVVDAVALRPALIKAYMDLFPYNKDMEALFQGVDGRNVPQDQWRNPPEEIRPAPLPERHRVRDEKRLEENRKRYYEMKEKMASGEFDEYPPKVQSDNTLY